MFLRFWLLWFRRLLPIAITADTAMNTGFKHRIRDKSYPASVKHKLWKMLPQHIVNFCNPF